MIGESNIFERPVKKDSQKYPGELVLVDSEGFKLRGNLLLVTNNKRRPGVVICHGAAKDGNPIDYLVELQKFLAQDGCSSLALHTRGVGQGNYHSDGPYASTLLSRKVDLISGVNFLGQYVDPAKLSLVVGSMNGESACFVAQQLGNSLHSLVLLEPAAYPAGAEKIPLGPEFRTLIRAEGVDLVEKQARLSASPAVAALEQFPGPVMLVYGDRDDVIDSVVQQKYCDIVVEKGAKGKFISMVGMGHKLSGRPDARLYRQIAEFLHLQSGASGKF